MNQKLTGSLFRRILMPVDFTAENDRALEVAVEMAHLHQSAITFIHVIKTIDHVPFEELESFYRKLEIEAREKVGKLEGRFEERGIETDVAVVFGRRVEEIVLFARENRVDLIILSSRTIEAGSPASYWGALSHKIGILSPCPVMLVKEKEPLRNAGDA